jgi:hypothetical protein
MSADYAYEVMERMQAEIAREIRVLLGEEQHDQRVFNDVERGRRLSALKELAKHDTSDEERHRSWMKMHEDGGWKYGPIFSPAEKEHPNMLPWEQLPLSTRSKARIFAICARYARILSE